MQGNKMCFGNSDAGASPEARPWRPANLQVKRSAQVSQFPDSYNNRAENEQRFGKFARMESRMHSAVPSPLVLAQPHAAMQHQAAASTQNPQAGDFDFQDAKAGRLCESLIRFRDVVGFSESTASLAQEGAAGIVTSPVVLWIKIYRLTQAIQSQLSALDPSAQNSEHLQRASRRCLSEYHKDWETVPFATQDPKAVAYAMDAFLTATLERCKLAFAAVEAMCRYRHLDRYHPEDAETDYARLCEKDRPWSILDFNFLPLLDLHRSETVKHSNPLTFEATGFVPTQNGMGYMTSCLDPFSNAFTWHSHNFPHLAQPALEIGAAFGVATIAALRAGARVVANDLNAQHLDTLKSLTPQHLRSRLTTCAQRFPENLAFQPGSFSSILVSRVLHFLTISQLQQACGKLAGWLEHGGHLFIVEDSPYLGNTTAFLEEYEARKAAGDAYPGMHEHAANAFTSRSDKLPDLFHFFDPEVLARSFEEVGLEVINCRFFPRLDYPADVQSDGREGVGLIARKPAKSLVNAAQRC